MQIALFFVFIVLVGLGSLTFGYGLSLLREQAGSRRCRMPDEMRHRKVVRTRRARCRYEG